MLQISDYMYGEHMCITIGFNYYIWTFGLNCIETFSLKFHLHCIAALSTKNNHIMPGDLKHILKYISL